MSDLLVVGTGLIGTSVGLALRTAGGYDVTLTDLVPGRAAEAATRGAGRSWDGRERAEVVLVAVAPAAVGEQVLAAQRADLGAAYTHVASVAAPVQEVVRAGGRPASFVGGHPLAGSERSGPAAARADLFAGRPWALCPTEETEPAVLEAVRRLVLDCGAEPVQLSAHDHDAAVALVSHLPQVVASALAARLRGADPAAVQLAGPGLADTTRIAASSPALWREVLSLNAVQVAPLVAAVAADLERVAEALLAPGPAALDLVEQLLDAGNQGRALVPVKRGAAEVAFGRVAVVVSDRPGQLAALLVAAAQAGVNVEDVRVDHVPGRPSGLIELLVAEASSASLTEALGAAGWQVARP